MPFNLAQNDLDPFQLSDASARGTTALATWSSAGSHLVPEVRAVSLNLGGVPGADFRVIGDGQTDYFAPHGQINSTGAAVIGFQRLPTGASSSTSRRPASPRPTCPPRPRR